MSARLTVDDVTLRFGGIMPLDGVSFDVADGELFAVIGPNGAGKTSLFNCLSGIYRPQQGSIRLQGRELVGRSPAAISRQGLARTFQNLAPFTGLSLSDNLMLGRHHLMRGGALAGMLWWGVARREELAHRERIEEIVELLELEPYRDRPAGTLPYGIQKKLELGRALAMEPTLLLLDEPVAGMNHDETADMVRSIATVRERLGLTILLVEHDVEMVMRLADRVLVLDFGRRVACGAPAEVQADEQVIEAYLGVASDEPLTAERAS